MRKEGRNSVPRKTAFTKYHVLAQNTTRQTEATEIETDTTKNRSPNIQLQIGNFIKVLVLVRHIRHTHKIEK